MPLDRYREMRDFSKTEEPSGTDQPDVEVSEFERKGTPRFVVQEHHATALHWDVRLERNGVLVSWAVPKGLPPDPRQNNLAVHTEDHPLSYIDFDGEIPKGEYGGGQMYVWDRGTYDVEKWSDREVMVEFHGGRVHGKYVFFQTDGKNWMVHRMDPPEDPSRELVPKDARPVEPVRVPASELPIGEDYRYLIAWKGERVAVAVDGGRCVAHNENGKDVTKAWPVLAPFGRAVGALPVVFVAQLASGNVFLDDVQWIDGHATVSLPFSTRRSLLERLDLNGDRWKTSPVYDDGQVVLEAARAQGQRGVYAVRLDQLGDEPPLLVE